MKFIILAIVVLFSTSSVAAPYLIEDHLKRLSSHKKSKKWTLKSALTGKKSTGGSAKVAPVVNILPSSMKENPKFEFSLGLEYANLNLDIDGTRSRYEVYRGSVTAFARFIGIMGNFYLTENSKENAGDASLALRLVGSSQQTTHLTLFYGVNKTKELEAGVMENVNNYIWGGELMLYFVDILAASYKLTNIVENTESDINLRRSGRRHEVKVLIDFDYFRVFGSHILEIIEYTNTSQLARKESQGIMGGVKLFF